MSDHPDFLWGAATAAYQIEGSTRADGRTPNDWDAFVTTPGAIAGGDLPDPAADHYRRWREDLALLADLGVNAYRFSVSWTRFHPAGSHSRHPLGAAFYDQLVDGLLDAGITPMVTIAHMELPLELSEAGGWTSRETIGAYADYAMDLHDLLSDRVRLWTTLNEIPATTWPGYGGTTFPPGSGDLSSVLPAIHHQFLAHGEVARAIRSAQPEALVGLVGSWWPAIAGSESSDDQHAAERFDRLFNRIGIEPLLSGAYDPDVLQWHSEVGGTPFIREGDRLADPLDYYGLNYYGPARVVSDRKGSGGNIVPAHLGLAQADPAGAAKSAYGWVIDPEPLRGVLQRFTDVYRIPVFVTENGVAQTEPDTVDGALDDSVRVDYHRRHVEVIESARREGADVRGYFPWTLLDNFDWAGGYAKRFGLVHVDFSTQKRTPKASFQWYRDHIAARSLADSPAVAGGALPGQSTHDTSQRSTS